MGAVGSPGDKRYQHINAEHREHQEVAVRDSIIVRACRLYNKLKEKLIIDLRRLMKSKFIILYKYLLT